MKLNTSFSNVYSISNIFINFENLTNSLYSQFYAASTPFTYKQGTECVFIVISYGNYILVGKREQQKHGQGTTIKTKGYASNKIQNALSWFVKEPNPPYIL